MTEVAEQHYLQSGLPKDRLLGLAVTRHGYARPTQHIPVIEAGHPVPDQTGIDATERRSCWPTRPAWTICCWCCFRRRIGELDRTRPRSRTRRQAGDDARVVALRRQHRRGQHRAQASLAHQGRSAGRARATGTHRHLGDFRRARRRPRRDRLRSDGPGSFHAGRCARHRRALWAGGARGHHC